MTTKSALYPKGEVILELPSLEIMLRLAEESGLTVTLNSKKGGLYIPNEDGTEKRAISIEEVLGEEVISMECPVCPDEIMDELDDEVFECERCGLRLVDGEEDDMTF